MIILPAPARAVILRRDQLPGKHFGAARVNGLAPQRNRGSHDIAGGRGLNERRSIAADYLLDPFASVVTDDVGARAVNQKCQAEPFFHGSDRFTVRIGFVFAIPRDRLRDRDPGGKNE